MEPKQSDLRSADLRRCDLEIERIRNENNINEPAWLVAMGMCDWELEKELILKGNYILNYPEPMKMTDMEKRPDNDPMVIAAIEEGRHADDIFLVECPWCGCHSYWNEGSHADCRNCKRDLTAQTVDAQRLEDYWDTAEYPCDEEARRQAERDAR